MSFEYVDKSVIKLFNKDVIKLQKKDEFFDVFVEREINELKKYESVLYKIISTDKKIKTQELEFLNNITLLGLKFELFKNENKNTKKSFVKYIYNIYMSLTMINNCKNLDSQNLEGFAKFMDEFKKNLESQAQPTGPTGPSGPSGPKKKLHGISRQPPSNILGSEFTSNPQIMSFANEIAKDIESQNVDPMSIIGSMMSGNPNPTVNNLIKNITSKLETKINTGEIDGNMLQEQANTMINSVQSNPMLQSFLPNLKNANSKTSKNTKNKK